MLIEISPSRTLTLVPPKQLSRDETGRSINAKALVPLPIYCAWVGIASTTHKRVNTMYSRLLNLTF